MNLEFKKLEAEDIPALTPFFLLRSNLSCDSVIFDSYLWRDYYQVEFTVVENTAVLMKMKENGETYGALPICRDSQMDFYFQMLEKYFHEQLGEPIKVYGADEKGLDFLHLDPARFEIREQVDQADYIYDAESLRTLSGRKYHKKKNNLNAFFRAYEGRWEYRRLYRESRDEIWAFLKRWARGKEEDGHQGEVEEHLEAEMRGLRDYLNHMEVFNSVMAGIYIDGQLEAFTIGSYNPVDRMSVVHVEKANGDIRGLYTAINQQFQQNEFPNALLVNREDDVGLPSLRRAKESYHPIMMGKKYDIICRNTADAGKSE
ncbi:MAG: phosphatidylglycerol lysyltransferase domain-containing protein [Clostridiales bacterium]|nr:phosphatidylglycerol lysyltransferase domain-containing protein [Clostridiales bacterium]